MARQAMCMVIGCGCNGTHKIEIARRGNRYGYLCDRHFERNDCYGTGNSAIVGKVKQNGIMIGREFELSFADDKARHELAAMSAVPTNDSSLHDHEWRHREVEFVFPTERGLNKMSKDAVSIERLFAEGHAEANDSCGTHLHVSTEGTRNNIDRDHGMEAVRRFYNSLFVPVTEVMKRNPEATKALFGRFFTHYAPEITMTTPCRAGHNETRYAWVNCTNSNRIEYRLVKFQNAKQYTTVVKACVEMTKAIDTNFLAHFNDTEIDSTRYDSIKAYRKHKAEVTANKIIKIFVKACAEMGYEVR